MTRRSRIIAALAPAALALAALPGLAATGIEPPRLAAPAGAIDPEQVTAPVAPAKPGFIGNPLWAIPLSSLSVTRERPIFTPSRRPPAPAVVALPPVAAPAAPAPAKSPEEPLNLALIGTVISGAEGFGVFLDQPGQRLVRLRTGEEHAGWTLRSVRAREVTMEKGARTQILSLPQPGTVAGPAPAQQQL